MARTSKRVSARTAARKRQAKANEDRRRREASELQHATDFEVARSRRDQAARGIGDHEAEMARHISALLALDNSAARVAELTGESTTEVRRLRRLVSRPAAKHGKQLPGTPRGQEAKAGASAAPTLDGESLDTNDSDLGRNHPQAQPDEM